MNRLLLLILVGVTALPASAATSRILAPMDWWPVWAPDGRHVAFTRVFANHMELMTLDVRTHRVVQVATGAGQFGETWSPDGKRVAYSSGGVLHIVGAAGGRKDRLDAPGKAYAPAWRPTGAEFAYLTTQGARNTDLWEGDRLWARNAIGAPSWSLDGTQLAFQRDDGVYVTDGPAHERRLVAVDNPGAPAWSHDAARIAYVAHGTLFVVDATGSTPRVAAARIAAPSGAPSWSRDDTRVTAEGAWSPAEDRLVTSGPRPACPGHVVLRDGAGTLTGSCAVVGTAGPDVIEGSLRENDVILAGAGNDRIHANDGHTDRVNCGPGRDTVWADRSDRLSGCEVIHH